MSGGHCYREAAATKRRNATLLACAALGSALAAAAGPVTAQSATAGDTAAAPPSPTTYANPIDIDYKYNFEQLNQGISYRSGADPVIVRHGNEYFLFETIAGGYWRSSDLLRWTFVTPSRWPFEDVVAPAALSVRDTLYLMQSSMEPRPILFSTDPASGRLEFYNRWLPPLPGVQPANTPPPGAPGSVPPGPWDPALFHDASTDKWYLYWDSSNVYPIYGIELDKAKRLTYVGTPTPLIALDPAHHGWERFGRDHRDTTVTPYVEGAWMTQRGAKYYLQYAAPGTEYNVYATGTYVGDAPLGPFTYAPYNPVAYRPGGFMTGAGHGNTFTDAYGNYWMTGTAWVAVNWNFERRIVLFPAGFDADGQMYADTRFGDFPHRAATRRWRRPDELFTGWMLLSYRKPVTSRSARDSFPASNTTDEDPRTFWLARTAAPNEWLTVDLGRECEVRAVQVNYADYKSGLYGSDSSVYTEFRLSHSPDGVEWSPLADVTGAEGRRDRPNAYVELPAPVRTRYVRYEHVHVGATNLAISDLRVFGIAPGRRPASPSGVAARRDTADARNATVSWRPVPGATGYNVRWGIGPTKLYQTYQVFADAGAPPAATVVAANGGDAPAPPSPSSVPLTLEIRALTAGQRYWFAVEAFGESGVSELSRTVEVR
ncbi:MAG TPA: family 43 glycosylhydrolase [Gemmatimonadaceae bacterium]|nr:family 43 glycosylhydrolase [Gemmatimonadaceae bacterium]